VTGWTLIAYGGLKLVAYAAVCWLGLRWVARRPSAAVRAALLGALRLVMGLVFGVGIFLASAWVVAGTGQGFDAQLLAYALVYVPVRWIEWSLLALLVVPASRSLRGFVLGSDGRDRAWRCVGIVVSCTADVPVLLAVGGLPVGRFCC
jgi:hypothetical protein